MSVDDPVVESCLVWGVVRPVEHGSVLVEQSEEVVVLKEGVPSSVPSDEVLPDGLEDPCPGCGICEVFSQS